MSPKKSKPNVDLVIPVYNEAGVVEQTYAHICQIIDSLPYQFAIYYVDDGSQDGTPESLKALAQQDARIIVLELSRNFGHQAALTAGLDASQWGVCDFHGWGWAASGRKASGDHQPSGTGL